MNIILASQSPRRRELLSMITSDFAVLPADVDESLPSDIDPAKAVALLAEKKAQVVFAVHPSSCVIGSDTVVAVDGRILGKPADTAEARAMLELLSGRWHTVYTGITVMTPQGSDTQVVATQVEFYPLTPDEIEAYIATDEPYDKAGGYGIQSRGGLLVRGIQGDYGAVVGLSTGVLYRMLLALGALSDGPK